MVGLLWNTGTDIEGVDAQQMLQGKVDLLEARTVVPERRVDNSDYKTVDIMQKSAQTIQRPLTK